jgi:hypothetical protein
MSFLEADGRSAGTLGCVMAAVTRASDATDRTTDGKENRRSPVAHGLFSSRLHAAIDGESRFS